ncbi:hypothetical protein K458DRAFT_194590 [Lentithecium fluviatile CBS 122367]|uniref:Uncharacterized protein n=1 Tax=Lentithecium fluviatile CBS 122367 TaxID=1168545 RepID=A0A6G1IDH1_9PLEO|nr:hypothetical protein K458DRAFT_194590 [Lentithecium fluviatile CBS 122367]
MANNAGKQCVWRDVEAGDFVRGNRSQLYAERRKRATSVRQKVIPVAGVTQRASTPELSLYNRYLLLHVWRRRFGWANRVVVLSGEDSLPTESCRMLPLVRYFELLGRFGSEASGEHRNTRLMESWMEGVLVVDFNRHIQRRVRSLPKKRLIHDSTGQIPTCDVQHR